MATNVVPTDSSSVFAQETKTAAALTNFNTVYVYPSPLPSGIGGLTFDIRGQERAELKSEITDHYLEDNTAIHDQISLSPEKVTLKGSAGDLVYNLPIITNAPTQIVNPLPLNGPLQPVFTQGTYQAQSGSQSSVVSYSSAKSNSVYSYYLGHSSVANNPGNKQALIFGYLYQLWQGRVLFTVETPWGIFSSMAIESVEPVQNETTTNITDFTVTFKKVRILGQSLIDQNTLAGNSAAQIQATMPVNSGSAGTVPYTIQQVESLAQGWLSSSINDVLNTALAELTNSDNQIAVTIQKESQTEVASLIGILNGGDDISLSSVGWDAIYNL